ncbi:hypothetical protein HELRODRAFT_180690 [Helobdella robusta]|uniref:Uncharacterized protein n=1 Tax=Helobdella robusta TaxID=6412 RepID=T1FG63_HELRO|nr:hypothetical protein HELRODRAFT_180690 [Helobdella robusta]ESN93600.1 hypothetical protein HELRODRAFT_180690 [Helobdella robusta]
MGDKMFKLVRIIPLKNCLITASFFTNPENLSFFRMMSSVQKNSDRRMERYLKKTADLIAGKTRKKSKNVAPNFHSLVEAEILLSRADELQSKSIYEGRIPKSNNPRVKRLSSMFYSYICGLLESGEVCPELQELAFQVSDVTVTPNFNLIIVSWLDVNIENKEKIMNLLPKCSADLRTVLTGLRVMGNIPPIQFSRDVSHVKTIEIEKLLCEADMGPEIENNTTENDCATTDDDDICETCDEHPHSSKFLNDVQEPQTVSQNVYGVNYEEIKNEVLTLKNKLKK